MWEWGKRPRNLEPSNMRIPEFSNLGSLHIPASRSCAWYSVNGKFCPFYHLVQTSCSIARRTSPERRGACPQPGAAVLAKLLCVTRVWSLLL